MSEQLTRIESLLVTLTEQVMDKFDKVDVRFEAMDQRFEAMDQRFEAMDQRFEAMDQRFEAMDQKFEARFQVMDNRLDELNGEMKHRFQAMDTRFDSMQAQLDRMEEAQAEDIVGILQMTDAKLDTVKALCEHTLKEQALLKYELDRLKPSIFSQSNKLFMNDLE